jgi:hypothetical protein
MASESELVQLEKATDADWSIYELLCVCLAWQIEDAETSAASNRRGRVQSLS